ncbi:unnamed protein product, partial [Dibothriocephalus latus]
MHALSGKRIYMALRNFQIRTDPNNDNIMEKTFWQCPKGVRPKEAFSFIRIFMTVLCLMLNLIMLVLLCLIKGRPRSFLVQMRTLTATVVLYTFIRTCQQIIPSRFFHSNDILAPIMCCMWTSRYLSFVCYTFAALILNFTVGNRAIQIVWKYQYSFS